VEELRLPRPREEDAMKGRDKYGVDETGIAPWSGRKDFARTATDKGNAPGITRPGPNLRKPRKRGKRISRNRTANDAAQAISKTMMKSLKEYER